MQITLIESNFVMSVKKKISTQKAAAWVRWKPEEIHVKYKKYNPLCRLFISGSRWIYRQEIGGIICVNMALAGK